MTREASIELILGYTTEERELLQRLVCGCAEPGRSRPFRLVDQLCTEELVEVVQTGGDVPLRRLLGRDDAGAEVTVICE
jgi:hypothetical protein